MWSFDPVGFLYYLIVLGAIAGILVLVFKVAQQAEADARACQSDVSSLPESFDLIEHRREGTPSQPKVSSSTASPEASGSVDGDSSEQELEALATEAQDLTDDLVVAAAALRRLSERRTELMRSQAAELARLRAARSST